jgi:hypothetical protein
MSCTALPVNGWDPLCERMTITWKDYTSLCERMKITWKDYTSLEAVAVGYAEDSRT